MMRRKLISLPLFAAAALPVAISSAFAQADVIIVTASKRAQCLNDIAASVDVIGGAEITKANGFKSAEEITQL